MELLLLTQLLPVCWGATADLMPDLFDSQSLVYLVVIAQVWDLTSLLESLADVDQQQDQAQDQQPPKKKRKGGEVQQQQAKGGVHQLRATAAVPAHDKDINSVAVAPNDQLIATGGGGGKGSQCPVPEASARVSPCSGCSACRRLLGCCLYMALYITWSVNCCTPLLCSCLAGSQDRTAKVWRLPGLTPVATLRGHKRGVWSVEFSPVDQALLTASGDSPAALRSSILQSAC
jgi:WD40 repeat protein